MNLAMMTTHAQSAGAIRDLVARGQLSAVAPLRPFSPMSEYHRVGVAATRRYGVPAVDMPAKRIGAPNFNHAGYVDVSRLYAHDAMWILRNTPHVYGLPVARAVILYFSPIAADDPNRQRLGRYQRFFDGVIGGGMLLPVALILVFAGSVRLLLRSSLDGTTRARTGGLLLERVLGDGRRLPVRGRGEQPLQGGGQRQLAGVDGGRPRSSKRRVSFVRRTGMAGQVAVVTAIILDRPSCRICIAEKSGLGTEDLDAALSTIHGVLHVHSTTERCRVCGAEAALLSIDRP
jgi:hypothetical protein